MADAEDRNGKTPKPPSIAVALRYEPDGKFAPRVVASGKGEIAEQILNLAFAAGVKVREDADLAQLLGAVDIDSEIPVEAFVAVAEILAYVYRANGEWPSFIEADAAGGSPPQAP